MKLITIYETLMNHYGDLGWWPADTPFEVMVGAILTQNTAWTNVEKAIVRFDGNLTPARIQALSMEELEKIIRPAGFYRQKAAYLKNLTAWFARYAWDTEKAKDISTEELRRELLAVRGIGNETADSILLYAFHRATFVVDAYTKRHFARIPVDAGKKYLEIKRYCEHHLPEDAVLYSHFHALIVENAKTHCRKIPRCASCPLEEICEKQIETKKHGR